MLEIEMSCGIIDAVDVDIDIDIDISMIANEILSRQIVSLAEDGAEVEQISKALDVEVALVKLVLERNKSPACEDFDRDIDDNELRLLRRKAVDLALSSSDEHVSARMTMFLIERDKPRVNKDNSTSLVTINQAIITAQKSFDALKNEYSQEKKVLALPTAEDKHEEV